MIDRLNVIANAVMTLGGAAFYLMIFSNAAPGFDASRALGRRSYWVVRVGLSFVVAGSLFATLTIPHVTLPQVVRNIGTAILFAWAAIYHARKWNVVTGVPRMTGTFRVQK